jgi:hypothetical protein
MSSSELVSDIGEEAASELTSLDLTDDSRRRGSPDE